MTITLSTPTTGTKKSASVTVALDPAYDTAPVGDGVTTVSTVKLLVSGLASDSVAWMDKDGNTTFNLGSDVIVSNGAVTASLSSGLNTFRFYQQTWNSEVSNPTYFAIDYDTSKAALYGQEQDTQLAQAAIAYLGRPLTTSEQGYLKPLLLEQGLDSVLRFLAGTMECQALYATSSYETAVDRLYGTLFARQSSAADVQYTKELLQQNGNAIYLLPWQVAKGAITSDLTTLNSKVIFAQQATEQHSTNLAAAAVTERTLLEIERSALSAIKTQSDATLQLEGIVVAAKNSAKSATQLTAPTATLDASSDTGALGDATTSASAAKINVSGLTSGAIAWLDNNKNAIFDVGVDYPVINGSVNATLNRGANTFVFYQMMDGTVSTPGYLSLLRTDTNLPPTQPSAPILTLNSADDDGANTNDKLTSKNLVTLNVSNLSTKADMAWIERDGNGVFNLGTDISLAVGSTNTSSVVSLTEGVNGFSAYQTVEGLTSPQGNLSVTLLKSTTVVGPLSRNMIGTSISLEFDTAINWGAMDKNNDGTLSVSRPGKGGELQITWGSTKSGAEILDFSGDTPTAAHWNVLTPSYGSRFLTINDVSWQDSDSSYLGSFSLLLVGIPDVSGSITSNVTFTWNNS